MALTATAMGLAFVAAAAPASAQASMSFGDTDFFSAGGNMTVTVTVAEGGRIVNPRFHHIREGEPLPKHGSRGWIEFPEMTSSQEVTFRAPQEEGDWWLILNDGKKLVARTSFDVLHWTTVLELMKRRVCHSLKNDHGIVHEGCEDVAGPADPQPVPTTILATPASVSGAPSTGGASTTPSGEKRLLQLTSDREIRAGDRVDVTVTDPDQKGPRTLELRWAQTTELSFAQKRLAPHSGPMFPVSVPERSSRVSTNVTAPVAPGQYDLLLYGDSKLLDALAVSVK